ncbi:MAG: Succinylornithine transaminase/acetylornithine aminotransferase [Hyphomicrobiaceae bacterium hypho_1]
MAEMLKDGPHPAVMSTYQRANIMFERGEGAWLITKNGDRYLDFTSGIAVNTFGHADHDLAQVLTDQARKLWHTSNLYRIEDQERLARLLCEHSFADSVFFCNSGAEACEGAVKLVRRYHFQKGAPQRNRIITFEGSFHGRTLAMIAGSGNPKYIEGFSPQVSGFDIVPFACHDAVKAAINDETAAIMIEPVMGEGGIRVVPKQCLKGLRELCDAHGLLLILDEVQTGAGRSGKLFAHEWVEIQPDVMAIAKGIGGGFPVGAILATEEAAKAMVPGTHGSTFGGNPLAMAVGCAVIEKLMAPEFLADVCHKGLLLRQLLLCLKDLFPNIIEEVRGLGLLTGVRLKVPVADMVGACLSEKLLTVGAGDNVMRLIPPLNITDIELHDAAERLNMACVRIGSYTFSN